MKLKRLDIQYFILGMLAILPYIWPYYINVVASGFSNMLKLTFEVFSYLMTVILVYFCRRDLLDLLKRSKPFIILNLCFLAVLLVSTAVQQPSVLNELIDMYKLLFLALLLGCSLVNKSFYLFKGIALVFNVIIVISFIESFVHFPGLSGANHFAATKNVYMRYIYLGIIMDAYMDFKEKGDISLATIALLGAVSVTVLRYDSIAGFLTTFVVFVLLLVRRFLLRNNMPLAKSRLFLYISVGLGAFVVFLRQFAFYEDLLSSFGKDLTFTGRTIIWDQALERIAQNPVFGGGHISPYGYETLGNETWSSASSHNFYLDVLLETGIVGIAIVLLILLKLTHDIDRCDNRSMSQCFAILFFCFLLCYDFDVFLNSKQYMYNYSVLFFLSFCFAGYHNKKRRIRFVWGRK